MTHTTMSSSSTMYNDCKNLKYKHNVSHWLGLAHESSTMETISSHYRTSFHDLFYICRDSRVFGGNQNTRYSRVEIIGAKRTKWFKDCFRNKNYLIHYLFDSSSSKQTPFHSSNQTPLNTDLPFVGEKFTNLSRTAPEDLPFIGAKVQIRT